MKKLSAKARACTLVDPTSFDSLRSAVSGLSVASSRQGCQRRPTFRRVRRRDPRIDEQGETARYLPVYISQWWAVVNI